METLEDKRTTRDIDILNTFFWANAHLLCACFDEFVEYWTKFWIEF